MDYLFIEERLPACSEFKLIIFYINHIIKYSLHVVIVLLIYDRTMKV